VVRVEVVQVQEQEVNVVRQAVAAVLLASLCNLI
jgi:hypothetical protein